MYVLIDDSTFPVKPLQLGGAVKIRKCFWSFSSGVGPSDGRADFAFSGLWSGVGFSELGEYPCGEVVGCFKFPDLAAIFGIAKEHGYYI